MGENNTTSTATTQDVTQQTTATDTNNQQGGQTAQSTQQTERTFTQADVDRMIADRLSRERRQHQQDIENARTAARTEAEELARMTAEERAQREQERVRQEAQQREEQLAQREAEITRRELRAQAIDTLVSRELPPALESILNYTSADACNASIDTVERVFRDAVQKAVDARLKASGVTLPAAGTKPDFARMSDEEYYASQYKQH